MFRELPGAAMIIQLAQTPNLTLNLIHGGPGFL